MKILTKLMLASAVMVTSGFAGGVSEFQEGGTLEADAKLVFEDAAALTMNADKSLHVYGSVEGDGQINCQGSGKVFVYQGAYAEDSTNADAIKTAASSSAATVHTYDADAGGSIDATVTVDPSDALVFVGPNLCEYASPLDNTNLVYVAIDKDGSSVRCTGETETTSEITCELANADAAISTLKPASLVVENKMKFSGNNTGFTSGTVTYGTLENPTETEIASQDAFFPVESVVERGSKLSLTAAAGTTISKNLTVNGGNKWSLNDAEDEVLINDTVGVLSVTGPVTVTTGTCLKLKGKTENPICEYPKDYPLVKSWPNGSFSGDLLNPKYRRYYEFTNLSVQDEFEVSGCVSVNELTGELLIESGMNGADPLVVNGNNWYLRQVDGSGVDGINLRWTYQTDAYDQYLTVYIDAENVSQYESASKQPVLLAGDDGVFSLALQGTDIVSRVVTNMLFQPNSLNLDNLDGNVLYLFDGNKLVVYSQNTGVLGSLSLTEVSNNIISKTGHGIYVNLAYGKCEGSFETGYFLTLNNGLADEIKEIDAWARTHTFEETWLTLEQYNAKHGTNYTFGG